MGGGSSLLFSDVGGANFVLPSGLLLLLLLLDTSDMECISNADAKGGGEEWFV